MRKLSDEEIRQIKFEQYERQKCSEKRRYHSESYAESEAKHWGSVRKGPGFRVYSCPWCKGWHLTKDRKREVANAGSGEV